MAQNNNRNTTGHAGRQLTSRERAYIAQRKRKKIRRRRIIAYSTIFFLVTAIIAGLLYGFFTIFRTTAYKVEGCEKYSAEEVFTASGIHLGGNLYFTVTKHAPALIQEKLPYVHRVVIKRKMPGTFLFSVEQTAAAVAMREENTCLLLDKNGKALERLPETAEVELPFLLCPEPKIAAPGLYTEFDDVPDAVANPLIIYKSLLSAIEEVGLKDITVINMSKVTDVTLVYRDRIRLHLGTPSQLEDRLRMAVNVLENENMISPEERGEIDLTVLKSTSFRPDKEVSAEDV